MNRVIMIGLGAGAIGVVGVVLIDHLVHGTAHTVLTAIFIVLLIAAVLLLHHVALQIERAMGLSDPFFKRRVSGPTDSDSSSP